MNRLLSLVRTTVSLSPKSNILNCYRAPKGGGKQEVPQGATTDYVGIFKDRPEPKLRNSSEYPEWFFKLMMPKPDILNLMQIWKSGEKSIVNKIRESLSKIMLPKYPQPTTNEILRLLHSYRKLIITDMNYYRVLKSNYDKKMPPDEEQIDMFEMLQGAKKAREESGELDEEDEEEEEEEETPKRKGPGGVEEETTAAAPAAAPGKGGPPGRKK